MRPTNTSFPQSASSRRRPGPNPNPNPGSTFTLTNSSGGEATQGELITFLLRGPNGTYDYDITGVNSNELSRGALEGTITVRNGVGRLTIQIAPNAFIQPNEDLVLSVITGVVNGVPRTSTNTIELINTLPPGPDPNSVFTFQGALAAQALGTLPAIYTITPGTQVEAGALSVAQAAANVLNAQSLLDNAQNSQQLDINNYNFNLADLLANLSTVPAASLLPLSDAVTLTNPAGNLGDVTAQQATIIRGATNAAQYDFNVIGSTFSLTPGIDAPGQGAFLSASPTDGATVDGILNAPGAGVPPSTFTNGDRIIATGANNTFNLAGQGDLNVTAVNARVEGIQNLNLTASPLRVSGIPGEYIFDGTGPQGWIGLTELTTTTNSGGKGTITVRDNTNVTSNVFRPDGNLIINGGNNVVVNSDSTEVVVTPNTTVRSAATVTINNTASIGNTSSPNLFQGNVFVQNDRGRTTSVVVNQDPNNTAANRTAGNVDIDDRGNSRAFDTISSVSVKNYDTLSIDSDALSNLTLEGGDDGDFQAVNGAITLNTTNGIGNGPLTLNLTSNGGTFGAIAGSKAAVYTSIALTASNSNTFANLTATNLQNLFISGSGNVTFTANTFGGANTDLIDARQNSGGVRLLGLALDVGTTFIGSSDNDIVSLAASQALTSLGNGNDVVVLTTPDLSLTSPLGVLDGGSGFNTINTAISTTIGNNPNFSNFQRLNITGSSGPTTHNANRFTDLRISGTVAGTTGFFGVQEGTDLTITSPITNDANVTTVDFDMAGAGSVLDVIVDGFPGTILLDDVAAIYTDAETVNITNITPSNLITSGVDTDISIAGLAAATNTLKALTINGNFGVNLDANAPGTVSTTLASVNASGIFNQPGFKGLTFTSAAVAGPILSVTGALNGGDTINISASVADANTVTSTAGTNSITGSATKANTLTGGIGVDVLVGGDASDTIDTGTDTDGNAGTFDSVDAGKSADLIDVALSPSVSIIQNTLDSGVNTANTTQGSIITSDFDVITGVTSGLGAKLNLASINTNFTLSIYQSVNGLAGVNNTISFAQGSFDGQGVFTFNPSGNDTLVTYDTDTTGATRFESVVLDNFVANQVLGTPTVVAGGIVTLA